jgi:hypothetical protein
VLWERQFALRPRVPPAFREKLGAAATLQMHLAAAGSSSGVAAAGVSGRHAAGDAGGLADDGCAEDVALARLAFLDQLLATDPALLAWDTRVAASDAAVALRVAAEFADGGASAEQAAAAERRLADATAASVRLLYDEAAFRRRSGPALKHRVGSGRGAGTTDALARSAGTLYACERVGCGALVDAGRARIVARRRAGASFEVGDGCAGPACAKSFRRRLFAPRQCERALAVLRDDREVAYWPNTLGVGTGRRLCRAEALRVAAAAIDQLQLQLA